MFGREGALTINLRKYSMRYLILFLACFITLACDRSIDTDESGISPLKSRVAGLYPKEFAKQQELFQQASQLLRTMPDSAKPYTLLASVYMTEARVTGDHPYYYPAALRTIEAGLEQDPRSTELLMQKTSVLLSLHRFEEARILAVELCTQMPRVATVYGMLCDANLELGRMNEAVQAATAMMSLRPGIESYSRVSYLRERHGDIEGALSAMKMAVQSGLPGTEDAAWTRVTYGDLLIKAGYIDEAERQFTLARLEREDYAFAVAGLARIAHLRKNDSLALAMLDSATQRVPEISFVELSLEIERKRNNSTRATELQRLLDQMIKEDRAAGMLAEAKSK